MIDTSRKHELSEVLDVDLSRDEDSVTSIAIAQSSDTSATVFAGINSSQADQQAGNNEHLRSFKLGYPPRKQSRIDNSAESEAKRPQASAETEALSKVSLFTPSAEAKKETYQRVLRLSPTKEGNGARLGAIATGLGPAGEIVIFDASKSSPGPADVRQRVQLGKGEEAADVDVVENKDGKYFVAYCTDYEVYICTITPGSGKSNSEPRFVHGTPHPDVFSSSKKRPTFRSLRFLTPNLLLLLKNQPNRSGAEVLLLEVPDSSALATTLSRKILHRSIKSASALATALLPSSNPTQDIQHVIAIAGQDISLTILTLYHSPVRAPSSSLKLKTHAVLYNVHPLQMTALAFSTFTLPTKSTYSLRHYLKLASTSMSSTVVVHTLPLTPHPQSSRNQGLPARFVLQKLGSRETAQISISVLVSIVVVAIGAFLLQAWTEIRGGTPEYFGAKGWLSQRVHDYIALPYMFEDVHINVPVIPTSTPAVENVRQKVPSTDDVKDTMVDTAESVAEQAQDIKDSATKKSASLTDTARDTKGSVAAAASLRPLLRLRDKYFPPATANDPASADDSEDYAEDDGPHSEFDMASFFDLHSKAIFVRDTGAALRAEIHDDDSRAKVEGKRWEDLSAQQKKLWMVKLIRAGEWTVGEGEAVLKGVFFSGIAGVVGGVVGGV